MIAMTLAEVAAVTGGRLSGVPDPDAVVHGPVEFDSRAVRPGGLFVALAGERVDGHDYAARAVQAGALAVLAERPVPAPAVLVPDVLAGLGRLARAVLDRRPEVAVVAITGSSGKTSTKDLLAGLVTRLGPTVAPAGSFNNELGHPYTVLWLDGTTGYLVLEVSARGLGHVAALCQIAPPRIGVVLNVGSAHLGEFGSREAIAAAKGELVEALPGAAAGGVAVLAADDPLVMAMADRTTARVVTFGRRATADVRAEGETLDDRGRASFTLVAAGVQQPVALGLHGAHHVQNALAAAAVALELGLDATEVAAALAAARPVSRWRMEVLDRPDGSIVINDAYNANPESMRAALQSLAAMSAGRRSWAVLGQMGELGPYADAAHRAVGRRVRELGIDRLVVVGPAAAELARGAGGAAETVADIPAAIDLLRAEVGAGDVVLIKASRSVGLERIAAALVEESG